MACSGGGDCSCRCPPKGTPTVGEVRPGDAVATVFAPRTATPPGSAGTATLGETGGEAAGGVPSGGDGQARRPDPGVLLPIFTSRPRLSGDTATPPPVPLGGGGKPGSEPWCRCACDCVPIGRGTGGSYRPDLDDSTAMLDLPLEPARDPASPRGAPWSPRGDAAIGLPFVLPVLHAGFGRLTDLFPPRWPGGGSGPGAVPVGGYGRKAGIERLWGSRSPASGRSSRGNVRPIRPYEGNLAVARDRGTGDPVGPVAGSRTDLRRRPAGEVGEPPVMPPGSSPGSGATTAMATEGGMDVLVKRGDAPPPKLENLPTDLCTVEHPGSSKGCLGKAKCGCESKRRPPPGGVPGAAPTLAPPMAGGASWVSLGSSGGSSSGERSLAREWKLSPPGAFAGPEDSFLTAASGIVPAVAPPHSGIGGFSDRDFGPGGGAPSWGAEVHWDGFGGTAVLEAEPPVSPEVPRGAPPLEVGIPRDVLSPAFSGLPPDTVAHPPVAASPVEGPAVQPPVASSVDGEGPSPFQAGALGLARDRFAGFPMQPPQGAGAMRAPEASPGGSAAGLLGRRAAEARGTVRGGRGGGGLPARTDRIGQITLAALAAERELGDFRASMEALRRPGPAGPAVATGSPEWAVLRAYERALERAVSLDQLRAEKEYERERRIRHVGATFDQALERLRRQQQRADELRETAERRTAAGIATRWARRESRLLTLSRSRDRGEWRRVDWEVGEAGISMGRGARLAAVQARSELLSLRGQEFRPGTPREGAAADRRLQSLEADLHRQTDAAERAYSEVVASFPVGVRNAEVERPYRAEVERQKGYEKALSEGFSIVVRGTAASIRTVDKAGRLVEKLGQDLKRISRGGWGEKQEEGTRKKLGDAVERLKEDLRTLAGWLALLKKLASPPPAEAPPPAAGGKGEGGKGPDGGGDEPKPTTVHGIDLPPMFCSVFTPACGDTFCGTCPPGTECKACRWEHFSPLVAVKGKGLELAKAAMAAARAVSAAGTPTDLQPLENIHFSGMPPVRTPPDGAAGGVVGAPPALAPVASSSGAVPFYGSPNRSPAANWFLQEAPVGGAPQVLAPEGSPGAGPLGGIAIGEVQWEELKAQAFQMERQLAARELTIQQNLALRDAGLIVTTRKSLNLPDLATQSPWANPENFQDPIFRVLKMMNLSHILRGESPFDPFVGRPVFPEVPELNIRGLDRGDQGAYVIAGWSEEYIASKLLAKRGAVIGGEEGRGVLGLGAESFWEGLSGLSQGLVTLPMSLGKTVEGVARFAASPVSGETSAEIWGGAGAAWSGFGEAMVQIGKGVIAAGVREREEEAARGEEVVRFSPVSMALGLDKGEATARELERVISEGGGTVDGVPMSRDVAMENLARIERILAWGKTAEFVTVGGADLGLSLVPFSSIARGLAAGLARGAGRVAKGVGRAMGARAEGLLEAFTSKLGRVKLWRKGPRTSSAPKGPPDGPDAAGTKTPGDAKAGIETPKPCPPCPTSETLIRADLKALEHGYGGSGRTRLVGSEAELKALHEKWSAGGTPTPVEGYDGGYVTLPDGTMVGWRSTSQTGGPTIDIKFPSGIKWGVHLR